MAETTNYQCPNCGGPLHYDGSTQLLQCDYCDSSFTPAEVERIYAERQARDDARAREEQKREQSSTEQAPRGVSAAEASTSDATRVNVRRSTATDPVQAYLENSRWDDDDVQNMRAYNCSSCGAQLMVDQVTAVTSCPYCGNNTVLPGQLSDVLKPDYVIPFKLTKDDAVAALRNYYKDKRFLPDTFSAENHLQEIQGVYVPFWLYSGKARGDVAYAGEQVTTWSDSDNMYTQTDHYEMRRKGSMEFARIPVDGSTKMPDAHMDAIEPFDYGELTDFSVAYLPGYITDRYDLSVKDCGPRAQKRAEATCESTLASTVTGYTNVRVESSDVNIDWTGVSYALLPVWMLHTKWDDRDFLFAMNGQTGKLIGDLPIDNGKVIKRFLLIWAPIFVIIVLIVSVVLGGFFS